MRDGARNARIALIDNDCSSSVTPFGGGHLSWSGGGLRLRLSAGQIMFASPGSTAKMKWSEAAAKTTADAVLIQRIWRGVLARRRFSDLFFEAMETEFGQDSAPALPPLTLPRDIADAFGDYEESSPKTPLRRMSTSLEEAQQEAAYNPSATGTWEHVPNKNAGAATAHKLASRRTVCGTPSAYTPSLGVSGARTPRWASSAALCSTPCASSTSAAASSSSAAIAGLGTGAKRGSMVLGHLRTPSVASSSLAAGAGPPAGAGHSRNGSEGGAAVLPFAAGAAGPSGGNDDLEFNEQMAESMSVDALGDLAKVLRNTIAKRNSELVALQLRRDELSHERDFRRQTVSALVSQVDKSVFVKEEKQKEKRRASTGARA